MKFSTFENIIYWLNLLLTISPVLLVSLPWGAIMMSTTITLLCSLVLLIPVVGTYFSIKRYRHHRAEMTIGQKALLIFPLINLLIISVLLAAVLA